MKFTTMIPLVLAAQSARAFVAPTGPLAFGAVRRVASRTPLAMAAAKEETGESLRRPQVIAEMVKTSGLTETQASAALAAFTDTVVNNMTDGNKITLSGFGVFQTRSRAGRIGRNPRTGEPLEIKPSTLPVFTPAKSFKEQVKAKHAE